LPLRDQTQDLKREMLAVPWRAAVIIQFLALVMATQAVPLSPVPPKQGEQAQSHPLPDASLYCTAYFKDDARLGSVGLRVDPDYRPTSMALDLSDLDGWTKVSVTLDPVGRKLPGVFSGMFFIVNFKQKPVFPLVMKAYADGKLRWKKISERHSC
jgi:hypothetical protein